MTNFIEIPASKKSKSSRKPILGVGINDADYMTSRKEDGKQKRCPYYKAWKNMLTRCYCASHKKMRPSYADCTVSSEWKYFSSFKLWMEKQDWHGKQLDKDIIMPGNKIYSPSTCVFVTGALNSLLTDSASIRGSLPQGVSFNKTLGKFTSSCKVNGKTKNLGYFTSAAKAEESYLKFKSSIIRQVAFEAEALSNKKIQEGLIRHADLLQSMLIKLEV